MVHNVGQDVSGGRTASVQVGQIASRWRRVLTRDEVEAAKVVAQIRQDTAGAGGKTNLPVERSTPEERLATQEVACYGEIGVSRVTNLAWTGCGKGSTGLPDVGGMVEARAVTEARLNLVVRPKDKAEYPYVLVQVDVEGSRVVTTAVGWAMKADVQRRGVPRDVDTEKPYWTLERKALLKMEALGPWLRDGKGVLTEGESCWTCGYQRLGGTTFLGVCGWFETHGKERRTIPSDVVDVGCPQWTDEAMAEPVAQESVDG